jgi:hypothetical protein
LLHKRTENDARLKRVELKNERDNYAAQDVEKNRQTREETLRNQAMDLDVPTQHLDHKNRQRFAQSIETEYLTGQGILQQAGQESQEQNALAIPEETKVHDRQERQINAPAGANGGEQRACLD